MAQTIPLSVPEDLLEEARETARLTHLPVRDVFRQSAKMDQPALRQSARPQRPQRFSVWDALASALCAPLILISLGCNASGDLPLEIIGPNLKLDATDVIWDVSNTVPREMEIFRVLPGTISAETISNLTFVCGLEPAADAIKALAPALDGRDAYFGDLSGSIRLQISPLRGIIDYSNSRARSTIGPGHNVPSEGQALARALEIAGLLGVDNTNLLHVPETRRVVHNNIALQETRHGTNGFETNYLTRGVMLFRAIKGFGCSGVGDSAGLRVEFGNDGRIYSLGMNWRRLAPAKRKAVALPQEMIKYLKGAGAVISYDEEEDVHFRSLNKLIVRHITPLYFLREASEEQKFVYPYALLECTAEGDGVKRNIELNCPILSKSD